MNESAAPDVGLRIRTLREEQGLSLRALARRSGLSINAISRIERGESSPTVSSLHRLALALQMPITTFFRAEDARTTVLVRPEHRLRSETAGLTMESLGSGLHNQAVEPFLVTVAPGAGNMDEPVTHPGEEFLYCLDGVIEYCVGDEVHRLEAGTSLLFKAAQPHCFRNPASAPATLMMIFQAEGRRGLARQHHLETAAPEE